MNPKSQACCPTWPQGHAVDTTPTHAVDAKTLTPEPPGAMAKRSEAMTYRHNARFGHCDGVAMSPLQLSTAAARRLGNRRRTRRPGLP